MKRKNGSVRASGRDGASLVGVVLALLVLAALLVWWNGRGRREEAFKESPAGIRAAAEGGDAEAALRLGRMYAEGLVVEQDWVQAEEWYRKAASQQNAEAEFQLGRLAEEGKGVPKDWARAAEWYRKAARQDHADAEWKLGLCFRDGQGVEQDVQEAKKWLEKASRKGHAEARAALAQLEEELARAVPDPAKDDLAAAERGDAAAQLRTGQRFMDGDGVEKDEAAGVEWYRKAAEQGNGEAQYRLGECLMEGRGTAQDKEAAEAWFLAAAKSCHAGGQRATAKFLMAAGDRRESVKWLQRAASRGDAEGQYLLALCYQKGLGTTKNPEQAKKWLQEAAKNGNEQAKSAIAAMKNGGALGERARRGDRLAQFELGQKLAASSKEQDRTAGVAWVQRAATSGLPEAAIWLGRHYAGRDAVLSFQWWSRAADMGSAEAQWQLVELCRKGVGTRASDEEALRWARKAADGGNGEAMLFAAVCFENGVGCRVDYREAKRWYERAGDRVDAKRMDGLISGKDRGGTAAPRPAKTSNLDWYEDSQGRTHIRAGKK